MNDMQYVKQGARNAIGVVLYVAAVALFLSHAKSIFGAQEPEGPLVPIMMMLLFVVSALATGSLVLWQPLKLLVDGKKQEAGVLLCATGVSLVVTLLIVGTLLVLRSR